MEALLDVALKCSLWNMVFLVILGYGLYILALFLVFSASRVYSLYEVHTEIIRKFLLLLVYINYGFVSTSHKDYLYHRSTPTAG
jgi:hypothetical protein